MWSCKLAIDARGGDHNFTKKWHTLQSGLGFSEIEVLEQLANLLERDEEDDGEGPLARDRRDEPLVERQGTLGAHGLDGAVERAGVGRRPKGVESPPGHENRGL